MKTLVFLKTFCVKNPTTDEQNAFLANEMCTIDGCKELGKIYSNEVLCGKDLAAYIRKEIRRERPDWVVAEGPCATVVLGLKNQKKVLINPTVTEDAFEDVPDNIRRDTFGFFDSLHERDYEVFQSYCPNGTWFFENDDLSLFHIRNVVESITKSEEW